MLEKDVDDTDAHIGDQGRLRLARERAGCALVLAQDGIDPLQGLRLCLDARFSWLKRGGRELQGAPGGDEGLQLPAS